MSNLRRYYMTGNCYFITNVTYTRLPVLVQNIDLYHKAIEHTCQHFDLEIPAWIVLPDHLHLIIQPKEENLSEIMKFFKQNFGFLYRKRIGVRTGRIWQLRFWDHVIRNEKDMNHQIDYIHYNPVKHGLVRAAREYSHSSFTDYVCEGYYQADWGEMEENRFKGEYGE